ncbi:helix-turn-helix domain-containing protein [Glutamicibacter uratoxydans]|uniref:helix-turn-helix domain-containing protein n=1 Tax=Glutamicibacter uratoxydans TaxID=43667 RepID=UPI001141CADF|nr:PucR family transcriptional regulator [Glutamicibacter uratoxydans]
MALTIRRLLQNPALNRSRPHILSGGARLDDRVDGIHIAESADLMGLIEGGELILCSGIALDDSVERASAFLNGLERSSAGGVVFSFLSDAAGAKAALRSAAAGMEFPVVLLDDRARFIEIIEAFHDMSRATVVSKGPEAVVDFLDSPLAGQLSAMDFLRTTAELLNRPIVLEDELCAVLFQSGLDIEQMLRYPQSRLRSVGLQQESFELAGEQWIQRQVTVRGRRVGRILSPLWKETALLAVVLEKLSRTLEEKLPGRVDQLELLRQELLADSVAELRGKKRSSEKAALVRLSLYGMANAEEFIPVVLCFAEGQGGSEEQLLLIRRLRAAFRRKSIPAVVSHDLTQWPEAIGIVVAAEGLGAVPNLLQKIYQVVEDECSFDFWSMGVGDSVESLHAVANSGIDDAFRVARGALSIIGRHKKYYRAHDLGFRWIIQSLAATSEGIDFVRDQLEPLKSDPELLDFLEAYLNSNGNIAELSRSIHLSRPSTYARLRRLQEEFGLDLESADTRTSLHLALAMHRLMEI